MSLPVFKSYPHSTYTFIILILLLSALSACKKDNLALDEEEVFELFDCSLCDYIVEGHRNDGAELDIEPGDIICLQSGIEYGPLLFTNIVGEGGKPVILRNCGGVATINSDKSFGIKFEESKNFRLLGDGAETKYGIKISTQKGFFLTMEYFTTDFEISRIEVAGLDPKGIGPNNGFAGMGIKTSPYQACDIFTDKSRKAWVMRNVNINNNYIHDVGGEGLYIGHGFYTGRIEADCSDSTYSHSIENLLVFENLIENTGFDGIQVKNADLDVKVYGNIINGYGSREEGGQNEGLFIGEGTVGEFYNNLILNGTGNGIQYQGAGNVTIHNNIIVNCGESGFYATFGRFSYRIPDGYHNIMNNAFINSKRFGFAFFGVQGGVKRIYNNIVAGSGEDIFRKGAEIDSISNIFTQNISQFNFQNLADGNIKVSSSSPTIDAGVDVSEFGLSTDFYGNSRKKGSSTDIGPYEAQ